MSNTTPTSKQLEQMEAIAKFAGFETLETRNSDELDFQNVSVWEMREMLRRAFDLGRASK